MTEMNVRADSVDVEQIMRQIRTRIREKRGVDYTEAEIQQLAKVKLEKFLDPRGVRSDLVEQFRAQRVVSPAPPNFEFGEDTLFETHRGLLKSLRQLFKPLLKLFFNPDKLTSALHIQAAVNSQAEQRLRRLEEREPLHYELIHNLTLEVTRLGIEVHNLRMHVESLSSRMDFDERRARSLEGVVQYQTPPRRQPQQQAPPRQVAAPASPQPVANGSVTAAPSSATPSESGNGTGDDTAPVSGERRRRRRRRRRRPGQTMADGQAQRGADGQPGSNGGNVDAGDADGFDANDDSGPDDGPDDSESSEQ